MSRRSRAVFVAAVAAAGPLAAVTAADAASPTRAQLRLMPLPRSAYGARATSFTLEPNFGRIDNKLAAAGELDPAMTAGKLAQMGRITGYGVSLTGRSATGPGRLLNLSSIVYLFRGRAGAARYLAYEATAIRRLEGKRASHQVMVGHVSAFAVGGVRGARGFAARLRVPTRTTWVTLVQFRVGRVAANVAVVRSDSRDARADARLLAKALERRIRGVLAGRIRDRH